MRERSRFKLVWSEMEKSIDFFLSIRALVILSSLLPLGIVLALLFGLTSGILLMILGTPFAVLLGACFVSKVKEGLK